LKKGPNNGGKEGRLAGQQAEIEEREGDGKGIPSLFQKSFSNGF
jgi:hypothetical protein